MLGTIYRSGVMSDIYHSGVQFNLDYKFCSYTTNTANQSADIKLSLPANKKITIYWGDGESTIITGEVTTTTYSHTYADIGTYNLTVSGDYNDITYLTFYGDGSYGGDIKYLPKNLIYFENYGVNEWFGDIQYMPNGILSFECDGSNQIIGDIKFLNSNCNHFRCMGFANISGEIQNFPAFITFFGCGGYSSIIGDIANFPDLLNYVWIEGDSVFISGYSGKTWITNFYFFKIIPKLGGLNSTEIDQLLIDLDEDLDWSGGGTITLTGTNAPRTSASDDAVNNIVAEGGTVICNN